ncbi:unnamed protein product, partial [Schistosoma turkestanicum]
MNIYTLSSSSTLEPSTNMGLGEEEFTAAATVAAAAAPPPYSFGTNVDYTVDDCHHSVVKDNRVVRVDEVNHLTTTTNSIVSGQGCPGPSARRLMHMQHQNVPANQSVRQRQSFCSGTMFSPTNQSSPTPHTDTLLTSCDDRSSIDGNQIHITRPNTDSVALSSVNTTNSPTTVTCDPSLGPSLTRSFKDILLGRIHSNQGGGSTSRSASYRRIVRARWHHSTG